MAATVRTPDESPVPPLVRCLCINCKYRGNARGPWSLMEVVKDHGVWCALERARAEVRAETAEAR